MRFARVAAGSILLMAIDVLSAQSSRMAAGPTLGELLARAGDYTKRFEQAFAVVISHEEYRQYARGRSYPTTQARTIRSEMLFMWLADERGWLTVRNALSVDGRLIQDSQSRLSEALADTTANRLTRLRRLRDEGARFNIGRIIRNFNEPMFAVLYVDPDAQYRFRFELKSRERVGGVPVWKIAFQERGSPTVIQFDGADQFSRGAVWVSEADGAIVRTLLEVPVQHRNVIASITVDFQPEATLGIWVPAEMRETWRTGFGAITDRLDGTATYSNFRRFETSARIVPQ